MLPLLPAVVEQGEAATGILFASYAVAMVVATLFAGRLVTVLGSLIGFIANLTGLWAATQGAGRRILDLMTSEPTDRTARTSFLQINILFFKWKKLLYVKTTFFTTLIKVYTSNNTVTNIGV